jgi:hypothetical protein
MKNLISDLPQRQAVTVVRFLYPIWIIIGFFSLQYIPTTFIVSGDAVATANKILANEILFRMGIAGSLIEPIIFVLAALALYTLLKPVNKNHASLMVVFVLLSAPIAMFSALGRVAALFVVNGADFLKVFGVDQLRALMMLFLNLNSQGILIATIFWGLWLFPLGYLVYKSGYFPRILGILVIIAGFGFLLSPFTHLLLPNYQTTLAPLLEALTIGEILFIIWLVFKGAKIPETKRVI